MFLFVQRLLIRYWLLSTIALFALVMLYTSIPIFGAVPTPTPNIQTVPKIEELLTPTNTPFPTATPISGSTGGSAATPVPKKTDDPTATPGSPANNTTGGSTDAAQASQPVGGAAPAVNSGVVLTGTVLATLLELHRVPSNESRVTNTLFQGDEVTVIGRTGDGAWWLICCGLDQRPGWAPAKAIQPHFDLSKAARLIPVVNNVNGLATDIITTTVKSQLPITATDHSATQTGAVLQLEMRPSPAFVWQGQQVTLRLIVTNQGQAPASNVQLRDELPPTLRLLKVSADQGGRTQQTQSNGGGAIVNLTWPQLAAGAKASALLTLQIAADLPDGALLDNLAVVSASNAAEVTAGITLAMPPTLIPQFR